MSEIIRYKTVKMPNNGECSVEIMCPLCGNPMTVKQMVLGRISVAQECRCFVSWRRDIVGNVSLMIVRHGFEAPIMAKGSRR